MSPTTENRRPHILIAGASRGLGHAMAAEFIRHGWQVTGTVRAGSSHTPLHALAAKHPDQLQIATLDITNIEQLHALRDQLATTTLDALFVNAGMTSHTDAAIGDVPNNAFFEVMLTNALSPMRVIETLQHLVPDNGLIGVMSSGQGSLTNNTMGLRELYRGSKAALNMFMRSFAARQAGTQRALALMAPGWVRTELGGPEGRLSIEESVPSLVQVLLDKRARSGLEYLDYLGRTVPW